VFLSLICFATPETDLLEDASHEACADACPGAQPPVSLLQTALDIKSVEKSTEDADVLYNTSKDVNATRAATPEAHVAMTYQMNQSLSNASIDKAELFTATADSTVETVGKESSAIGAAAAAVQRRLSNSQQGESKATSDSGVVFILLFLVVCATILIVGIIVRSNLQDSNFDERDAHPLKARGTPEMMMRSAGMSPGTAGGLHSVPSGDWNRPPPAQATGPLYPGSSPVMLPRPASMEQRLHANGSGSMHLVPGVQGPGLQGPPSQVAVPPTAGIGAHLEPLPPICPSLILPRTEARFLIAMADIMQIQTGDLHIKGTSGRPLLIASVGTSPNGARQLALASIGCEDDPRALVFNHGMMGAGVLEVRGRSGQPYGVLQPMDGGAVLLHQNRPVMKIVNGPPSELCMTATGNDGTPLGVGRGGPAGGGNHWKLTVRPGQDAVLIAVCMLSLIILTR